MVNKRKKSDKSSIMHEGVGRRGVLRAIGAGVVATVAMPKSVLAQKVKIGAVVEMNNDLLYVPDKINIKVGETVEWRNVQSFPHSVTADPGKVEFPDNVELPAGARPFNSGAIRDGQVYRHRFDVAGVYRYVCIPHERVGMLGTVIVS